MYKNMAMGTFDIKISFSLSISALSTLHSSLSRFKTLRSFLMVSRVCMVVISGGEALTNSMAYYGKDYGSALIEVVRVWVKLDDVSQKHDEGVNEF
ncbi:hypothetical protein RIF29_16159 [Crotalaria pallida]|uniref:Uncharacterized protein n=1 Tax=Crotalaria pallida TaxID=3830 RepID=A0AAN9FEL1_CROPI